MKKITGVILACAFMLTGCGKTETNLPSLDAAGIDVSTFTKSDEKYDEETWWKWCYDAERPHFKFDMYTSPDGAKLAIDEEGRVVRFRNTPEIMNADFIENEDVPLDKINSFIAATVPEGISVSVESCVSTSDGSRNKNYYGCIEQVGENGYVNAELNGDGTIQQVDFEYYVPEDKVDTAPYDEEAEAIIRECTADGEGSVVEKRFVRIDGQIYGYYDILTGFRYSDEAEASYGTYYVLVRPEHETVPLKKTS